MTALFIALKLIQPEKGKIYMKKYDVALFDLDGTLFDTGPGVTNCVQYALEKLGIIEKDRTKLFKFIGPPLSESFHDFYGFDAEKTAQAIAFYRERYGEIGIYENDLYEGMNETIEALYNKGVTLLVATSKPEPYAKKILEKMGIAKYFSYICGATFDGSRNDKIQVMDYALGKVEDNKNKRIIMVGDRHYDINGANHFKLDSIGVSFGYGSREELEKAGATYIVDKAKEILEII